MSTPDTLRWWGDQIRKCTKEFYFSHVLVADLNYGADEIEELQAENAKLRELVLDAWGNGHPDRSCGDCDIRDECHNDIERLRKDGMMRFSRCLFELRIEDRMRELGVEVDG